MQEALQRRPTIGQVYMTTYGGDQQIRKLEGNPKVWLNRVEYAGFLLYGWDNPYAGRVRRTVSDFSQ